MRRGPRVAFLLALVAAAGACLARRPPVSEPRVEQAPPPRRQEPLPPPVEQLPRQRQRTYEVQPGDTLFSIARAHGVSVDELVRANDIQNPDLIYPGQVLVVPGEDPGAAPAVAEAGPRDEPEISAATGDDLWSWPVEGQVLSHFGKRGNSHHAGIDIAAENGAPVRATADGRVAYSGRQRGYGLMVVVVHDNGYTSLYAHVRRVLVRPGQNVRQGAKLAEVGRTGNASGCHLHFEIRLDDRPLDPLVLLAM